MIQINHLKAPPRSALLNETATPLQIGSLFLQAPFLASAPRGRGGRVLVFPGYGASDASTAVLRGYLSFLGYRVAGWGQGANNGDVLTLLEDLKAHVLREARGEPVTLIGWSLGGYLAREVARDLAENVRHVITMGSPVLGGPKYTAVATAFSNAQGGLDVIEQLVAERYNVPLKVPVTALYSKLDGVVAWEACIDPVSDGVEHVEILSTHAGFGFSATAYQKIAHKLAEVHNP